MENLSSMGLFLYVLIQEVILMAKRSVFISKDQYPFFEEVRVEFDWFS